MTLRAKETDARLTDPGQARCEGQRSKLAVSGSCVALGADALWTPCSGHLLPLWRAAACPGSTTGVLGVHKEFVLSHISSEPWALGPKPGSEPATELGDGVADHEEVSALAPWSTGVMSWSS